VGGLVDTVKGYDGHNEETATGFFIRPYTEKGFCAAVEQALAVYKDKKLFLRLVRNAMRQDVSWDKSAEAYLALYHKTTI
jgi:starch synthase